VSASLHAQVPEIRRLPPPTAQLPEEFTNLTSLRELSDGRVLITDRKDARLAVVDFSTGSVKAIGRLGSGPAEYQDLGPVFALSSDTSVVIDIGNSRWLILVEDRIAATLPPDTPAIKAVLFWVPFGADRLGHVLSMAIRRGGGARTDSVDMVLITRATGRTQLVGALRYGLPTQSLPAVSELPGGRGVSVSRPPFNIREEQRLLFPDGWIAVARYEPYRVDWRSPNGEWRLGPPLPVRTAPFTTREREAYIRRSPAWARRATEWPVNVPPFDQTFPLLASPDGSVVIPRVPTADQPEPRYDVIDRQGALGAQLLLPMGQRLLALGARSAYVVVTDTDGIERLQRHSWP
jgi:hypothetical protein